MNKEEILKLLGENIKLDILLEYINHNEVMEAAHTKRLACQRKALETESKINSILHNSKFYLSEITSALISFILTFIILKYLIKLKSIILLIVLVLVIGGNIGYFLNSLSENIAKIIEKDKILPLKEELHKQKETIESCKIVENSFGEIIETIRKKIHANLDNIKLNYDGDIYLLSIINAYLLLITNMRNSIQECEKYFQENNLRDNNCNIVLYLEKGESFEDYYNRYMDEVKFGLKQKERDILKNIPPIDTTYQDTIIKTANECKNLID